MSYEPFDSPDAPPLGDADFVRPGVPSPDATAICISLDRIAKAVERLAPQTDLRGLVNGLSVSPGGAQTPVPSQPPGMPTGPPAAPPGGASNETQIKRGKAIYAKCMNQTPPANVKAIGEHVVLHTLNGNSQKWDEADQVAVLDAMKSWGWA